MESAINITELFIKYRGPVKISNPFVQDRKPHPFSFLELGPNLKKEFKFSYGLDEYWKIQKNIKEEERKAMNHFELEFSLLLSHTRNSYLNNAVAILIKIHRKLLAHQQKQADADLKVKQFTETYFPIYNLLELSNRAIFTNIYLNYHGGLNSINFKHLSLLYDFRKPLEPLKSFKRVKVIADKKFEELFQNYIIKTELLPKNTQFRLFKELFLGQELKQKMDWQGPLGALGYLIKHLKAKEAINVPQDEWKITAEFFTFKGLPVPKTVNVQSAPREDLKKSIELFVDGMLSV